VYGGFSLIGKQIVKRMLEDD